MELRMKSKLNFLIEGISLLALTLLIATGLTMEFRLPPGSGGEGAALHGGVGRQALTLAGISRHEWGAIHFYLANGMLVLLALHVWLHWRWIWAMAQGAHPASRKTRGRIFLMASLVFLGLTGLPWLIPIQSAGPSGPASATLDEDAAESGEGFALGFPVNGRTTINEIARAAGVSTAEVIACLEMQGPVGGEERLGPLTRRQNITMAQMRERLGRLKRPGQIPKDAD